jgi:dipeptidyl aminopeptidase/acylaminoacyl peptidase
VERRIVSFSRADGVRQSATLLLPPGHDPGRGGRLPLLLWVYPDEHRDASGAGQVADSTNRYSELFDQWHRLLLHHGVALLEGRFMPIVAEAGKEPNDSLAGQLVANARATLRAVGETGLVDLDRVAVAGHSYGAFLAAGLVAHTRLFRAAVAISGAYNRTLTPFGFQHERRTFWEAPGVYMRVSPFSRAHRIRTPLLLIHGEADDNPGTPALQSERLFHALQGHGATVRYVLLPHEGHGIGARESVLHLLAEMVDWLDRHLAPRPARRRHARAAPAI